MPTPTSVCTALLLAILTPAIHAETGHARDSLRIPEVQPTTKRAITVDDLATVRTIDSLSVSPDGRHYAVLVRQAEPAANEYRSAWFSGSTQGGQLVRLGDGGEARPRVMPTGHVPGMIGGSEGRWSPDGQWLAYTLRSNDQIQLWRSRVDGSAREQLTNNAADVREFAWSDDGTALYFTAGTARTTLRAQEQARAWQGYQYDEDFWQFTDLLGPQLIRPLEANPAVWLVTFGDARQERLARESEQVEFARAQARDSSIADVTTASAPDTPMPPVAQVRGNLAWRVSSNPEDEVLRVVASVTGGSGGAIKCSAAECSGAIKNVWWSENGRDVLFLRGERLANDRNSFYSWTPASGKVSTRLRLSDDDLRLCSPAGERLICVRETASQPAHVAAVDLRSGRVKLLADINAEFRNFRLGKVERFEWDTPTFSWNEPGGELAGLYARRTYGYILYPPDFDPSRKYPVFIDPYVASGFNSLGAEHALHAYAANDIIVLRMTLPLPTRSVGMDQMYSAELDYPHLTLLMESTVRGLDSIVKRGFIDEHRVGIGGVSHGTFVPLYMMQKHNRIAAISISSPHWGPLQNYWNTQKARATTAAYGMPVPYDPQARSRDNDARWDGIDIAEHVQSIEAPILMHLAAHETYALIRLIRRLADAGKPYDAYVFPAETHVKWQAAHLHAITGRNLDWFRFWLQDVEDPNPAKAEQYLRWRKLREQQRAGAASSRGGR